MLMHTYSCSRFESRTGRPLLCVIPHLSSLFPVSLHCPIIKGIKSPPKKNFFKNLKIRIKMYEKNTHTNVRKKHLYKHAYKCMKRTCIQTRIQMFGKKRIQMYNKNTHTNTLTNVWKKYAYKCMTKTRIQTRTQMYGKKQAYKVWKKTHTNVWKKHAYKHA